MRTNNQLINPVCLDSISYSPPGIFLDFAREFSLISQKKGSIWCWLFTGLVDSKTVIHLSVGEER